MVGDSITFGGRDRLAAGFSDIGWQVTIDGKVSRSITNRDPAYSGVAAVTALVNAGVTADTWIVALGANDVDIVQNCQCTDKAAFARDRFRQLLAAIGPGQRVFWVATQDFHYIPAALILNAALADLVVSGELAGEVDWYTASADHQSGWFEDQVHLTSAGYTAWVQLITLSVGPPPPPTSVVPGVAPARRAQAEGIQVAVRLVSVQGVDTTTVTPEAIGGVVN